MGLSHSVLVFGAALGLLGRASAFQGNSPVQSAPVGAVSVYVQQQSNMGAVWVFDELSGQRITSPAPLWSVRLLEIDFVGRTQLDEFLPDRPRYLADVPSATRLQLPRGNGSLYHYRSLNTEGGTTFGYLHIDSSGRARPLGDRAGIGRDGLENPYLPRVAVAPDGASFLAATKLSGGGDLLEISLRGDNAVLVRTANDPPYRFRENGLGLQWTWGLAVTSQGVLRFARTSQARPALVPTVDGEFPFLYQGDVVFSGNGEHAITIAGNEAVLAHVWKISRTGPLVRVTENAGLWSGAGSLPEHQFGPYMAVSNDGRLAAWRSETDQRELFLARVPAPDASERMVQHVTRQELFDATLDEIGLTRFYLDDRITFFAGARDYDHGGLNRADAFSARLSAGSDQLVVANNSGTSLELVPPFVAYGTLEPERVVWIPSARRLLVHDGDTNGKLWAVRAGGGTPTLLLDEVRALDLLLPRDEGVLFGVRRTQALGQVSQLMRLDPQLLAAPLIVASGGNELDFSRAASRRDGWATFVTSSDQLHSLSRVDLETGVVSGLAVSTSSTFGQAIGHTLSGASVFSLSGAGTTATFLWPAQGGPPVQLSNLLTNGTVLPGN